MCVMFCFCLHIECLVIEGKSEKRDSLTTKTDTTSSGTPTETTHPSSQSSNNSKMYNIVFICVHNLSFCTELLGKDVNPIVFRKLSFSVGPECKLYDIP